MAIEKEDIVNALKVLATMLKAAKLSTHDVAELMIKELEFVDFVPAVKTEEKLQQNLKFNKSFEALYNISMAMADECIGNKSMTARYEKLNEEFEELREELLKPWLEFGSEELLNSKSLRRHHTGEGILIANVEEIEGELADVLFVLLHIAHKFKITPFTLMHKASSKMLARMNDSTYIAKN